MSRDDFEIRVEPQNDVGRAAATAPSETPIGELFKRLGGDTGTLIRQEAALAKAEIKETGSRLARDGAKIGVAAGLALVGVLALSAFLIIALGNALDGAYWLSSLIVGGVALVVGAVLVSNAVKDMKRGGIAPEQTVQSLREDKEWVTQQAKELKQDLTADPAALPSTRR